MIPAVFLAFALVTPAFTFPSTTQGVTTTGTQGTEIHGEGTPTGTVGPTFTQGEKSGLQGTPQGYTPTTQTHQGGRTGISETQTVGTTGTVSTHGEKTGFSEVYTENEATRPVTVEQVEPVRVQSLPESQYTESQTSNPTQQQATYNDRPLLLPVQPLSVLPVNQGQILTPVVVPAEAITSGRFIIMAVEPIKRFIQQDVATTVEKQVPYQQTTQPVAAEPDQVQLQAAEPVQQVYNVQPVKQVPYTQETQSTVTGYVPTQSHTVEPVQHVQSQEPRQTNYQTEAQPAGYVPVQVQQEPQPVQQVYNVQPEVTEPVKQVPYQQETQVQVKPHQHFRGQQTTEYTQEVQQQTVNPIVTDTQKSTFGYIPVQGQTYEPNQQVNSQTTSVEKGSSVQSVPDNTQTTVQVDPNYQQVYNVQQGVTEKQATQQQTVQQQTTGYTQGQTYKHRELNPPTNPNTQPQPYNNVANPAEYVAGNYGEKIPQHQASVQNFSGVPENQQQPIVPSQQQ